MNQAPDPPVSDDTCQAAERSKTPEPPGRILVVDDTPISLELLAEMLSERGYIVRTAGNGTTALESAAADPPELILLDVNMPDLSGYEVCRRLKQDPKLADIPVIFISALHETVDKVKAFDVGAVDYLTKPFHLEEVLARVANHLRLLRYRRAIREQNQKLRRALDDLSRARDRIRQYASRLEADEEAGKRVQFRLLPQDGKTLGAYRFQWRLMPSMVVSGDFVDYFDLDGDLIGFYIADVSGHGVASAFVTVLVKAYVNHAFEDYRRGRSDVLANPARFLGALNDELLRESLGKHVALFYGVLERQRPVLRAANAGQFPFPILASSGAARYLEAKHPPAGLFPDARYRDIEVTLPETCQLTMFSDGALDLMPGDGLQEQLRLLRELAGDADTDIAAIAERLRRLAPEELPDDVAILRISRGS